MKTKLHTLVVLSALAITSSGVAQTKASPPANYKQQNLLLAKKNTTAQTTKFTLSNDFSLNPLANHRNYKAQFNNPRTNEIVFEVELGNRHKNYKQKNLLTIDGHRNATRREEGDVLVLK